MMRKREVKEKRHRHSLCSESFVCLFQGAPRAFQECAPVLVVGALCNRWLETGIGTRSESSGYENLGQFDFSPGRRSSS
jgi:hypothetical protein